MYRLATVFGLTSAQPTPQGLSGAPKPVSMQHHYIANNMEYLKRTADEHLSLLREPDLLMVIKGGEMAYTRPDGVKIIPLACLKD